MIVGQSKVLSPAGFVIRFDAVPCFGVAAIAAAADPRGMSMATSQRRRNIITAFL
ncbi:hypothetical protein PAMC26510_29425 [Caballeronia sordidicola]|uniref:Uncharacterized protein n=1 Tax=Caballeronia sordidicola TaxID=196367 RepID=A0A242MAB4_CABSO|nr:hypothetical protein PAMC26510_29425 [Caballeronia sordidicola]